MTSKNTRFITIMLTTEEGGQKQIQIEITKNQYNELMGQLLGVVEPMTEQDESKYYKDNFAHFHTKTDTVTISLTHFERK